MAPYYNSWNTGNIRPESKWTRIAKVVIRYVSYLISGQLSHFTQKVSGVFRGSKMGTLTRYGLILFCFDI